MYEREVLQQGEQAIRNCLDRVPFLKVRDFQVEPNFSGRRPDFVVRVETIGGQYSLVVEAKSSGQPRVARRAIDQLRVYSEFVPSSYTMILAPYISDVTARLCEREGVGYVDLAGNCRLSFGQVYIEQRGKENPYSEKRELRSLYSPKAERVLRVLLTSPLQSWRVQELADEAGVSLGLVSKVKRILEDREWLDRRPNGFKLLDPQIVLEEWVREYRYTKHQTYGFYSLNSGGELEAEIAAAAENCSVRIALTGFSSAARYAPAVRYRRAMLYVDGKASALAEQLALKQVPSGANLTLIEPYDTGVFYGADLLDGLPAVSPVQTYLDLMKQAARGEEAAEALMQQVIQPSW